MSRRTTASAPPRHPALRLLTSHVRRHWGALAGAAATTVALTLAQLAAPWPLKIAIDQLVTGRGVSFELSRGDVSLLLGLAALVLGIAAVDALATYYSDFWLDRSGEQIVHDLRTATYEHLQRLSLVFHSTRPTGDLVARVTGDVNAVGDLFAQTLGTLASSALVLVGMFAVMLWIDPPLAFVAFLVTPLLLATSTHYQKRIRQMARTQRAQEGEIASMATEALSAIQVIKAFGTERFENDRVQVRSAERLEIGVQSSRVEARFGALVDVLGAVATALVLALGVLSVADGRISAGDLVVVVAYTNKLYKPLKDIAKQSTRAARAFARLERIAEILSFDMELGDGTDGWTPDRRAVGTIDLHDVSFRYNEEREPALQGVTLHVPAGSRLALVGKSGAGKSTVGALIARFYDPGHGSVRVDGQDARELSLRWVRDQVGVLLQDTILFSGSVRDNIAYGTDADLATVRDVARAAGALSFIDALPDGLDTLLGPGGIGLSGGQRQRIGIARVLLRDPPVLVLDEPTTGLDAASEALVMAGLNSLVEGRTTILITHSVELARKADHVAVMVDGRIVEYGAPEQLLSGDSAFRLLTSAQQRHDLEGLDPSTLRDALVPDDRTAENP
ncbi:ABC transporter ATP-binding protein [Nocardioides iriomotensis]|uniref:ABC transporter ATP-binding protein n=1 Tax=Nocardioides iriomotensis TaxID=715784 RepID=A0A4Q5J058_9ACTN|nr:ABC transporter ATP-binding protein [Nocardioides iriomotensis]RYU10645.1 ABC transporter ATP-binding protein [Nocardioides iriomotensis]